MFEILKNTLPLPLPVCDYNFNSIEAVEWLIILLSG